MKNKTPIPRPRSPDKSFRKIIPEKEHGFTLIELIVVIIIVGILAAVGMTQYSSIVEKSRTSEAKIRLGAMRQLVYEYYLNNGTLTGITNDDLGISGGCTSTGFYWYWIDNSSPTEIGLYADRCTGSGKTPDASRRYQFFLRYWPGTGVSTWCCRYADDVSPCFGLPAW